MIGIVNVSEKNGLEYGKGLQIYDVVLNYFRLTTFEHNFEDGMVVCVEKAAEALSKIDISQAIRRAKLRLLQDYVRKNPPSVPGSTVEYL